MITVVGQVADPAGAARQAVVVASRDPAARSFDIEYRSAEYRSTEYRRLQPPSTVDVEHSGAPVGEVKYLECNEAGRLSAVVEVDGFDLDDGPWYFSPEIRHFGGRDITMTALAVTRRPASVPAWPVVSYPGPLRDAGSGFRRDAFADGLLKRAAQYDKRHRRGDPLAIVDLGREDRLGRLVGRSASDPAIWSELEDLDQERTQRLRLEYRQGVILRVS